MKYVIDVPDKYVMLSPLYGKQLVIPWYASNTDKKEYCLPTGISLKPYQFDWISCSDHLPGAENKKYWVCTDSGYQCTCRWTNRNPFWTDLTSDWHWNIHDIPQYTRVVAWMDLPEKYKEDDNGED